MLRIQNACKTLGQFSIRDINLEVDQGQYFVLLGPSGTGKTVLLEIIAGFHTPDKGKVFLNGKDITRLSPEFRKMGFVYQDYMLFPHMNVQQNIFFGARKRFAPEEIKKRLGPLVEMLQIDHIMDRFPMTLSGGEQQRVALARSLITAPEILLLDEPLSSLDPNTKETLQGVLKEIHRKYGTTVLHITHDFNEALNLASHVGLMLNGSMAQVGEVNEIFRSPKNIDVATFLGIENIFPGSCQDGVFVCNEKLKFPIKRLEPEAAYVYFLSDDVTICNSNSAHDFKGSVKDISKQKDYVTINVDMGHVVKIKLSHREFQLNSLQPGNEICFSVNPERIGWIA
ncbi:MAG: ATP-binding cassette domain-containing protein [Desulfitobacteriaceae bacterium]|nr:ATP-binding cassette domain-containing protein [Desulfitobacteriaceae bacterium]